MIIKTPLFIGGVLISVDLPKGSKFSRAHLSLTKSQDRME